MLAYKEYHEALVEKKLTIDGETNILDEDGYQQVLMAGFAGQNSVQPSDFWGDLAETVGGDPLNGLCRALHDEAFIEATDKATCISEMILLFEEDGEYKQQLLTAIKSPEIMELANQRIAAFKTGLDKELLDMAAFRQTIEKYKDSNELKKMRLEFLANVNEYTRYVEARKFIEFVLGPDELRSTLAKAAKYNAEDVVTAWKDASGRVIAGKITKVNNDGTYQVEHTSVPERVLQAAF